MIPISCLICPAFCLGLRLYSHAACRMLQVAEQTAPVLSPHMAACASCSSRDRENPLHRVSQMMIVVDCYSSYHPSLVLNEHISAWTSRYGTLGQRIGSAYTECGCQREEHSHGSR